MVCNCALLHFFIRLRLKAKPSVKHQYTQHGILYPYSPLYLIFLSDVNKQTICGGEVKEIFLTCFKRTLVFTTVIVFLHFTFSLVVGVGTYIVSAILFFVYLICVELILARVKKRKSKRS